jgi:cell division protein FtsQ
LGIGSTKQERRAALRAAVRRVATVLVLGVLIVAALYLYEYLTTSAAFSVAEVELQGVTRIDDADFRRLLADLEGHNLFLAPLDDLEKRLEMHPRIRRASMSRVVPDRIVCHVDERVPVALIYAERFLEVDDEGMVMEEDAFTPLLDLPIITGVSRDEVRPGGVTESRSVQSALEVLRAARSLGAEESISEVHVDSDGVTAHSLESDRILVLGDSDYEQRLRKYFLLRDTLDGDEASAKRIVDLRFEDQVVLRAGN